MLCVASKLNDCINDQKREILEPISYSFLTVLFVYQKEETDWSLFSVSDGFKLKFNK